ncbi:hypothetical protein WMF27_32360 [Sorangium sp. So ce281]|uniref:hypothetical protein n=1 Tax=unclassified Sorangium TaxID=2621164 RepID=UPI003F63FBAC
MMFGTVLGVSLGCGGGSVEPAGDSGGAPLGEFECRVGADCNNNTCNRVSDAVCYEIRGAYCGSDEDCAGIDGESGGGGAGGGGGGAGGGGAGPPIICEAPHFTCPLAIQLQLRNTCVRGCETDADCPSTLACSPEHRCRARSCAAEADCPKNHVCDTTGACARTACSSDADCEGFCVLGRCEEKPGMCFLN